MQETLLKSKCPIHDRAFELICTKKICSKPRLGCTKCFYDKTHKECKSFTVLLEDLTPEDFTESLESWIIEPEQRKKLNEITGLYPYELEAYEGEIIDLITKKFEKIRGILLERLVKLENDVKSLVKTKVLKNETMNIFKNHYSLRRLKELIGKSLEKMEKMEDLNEFFNYSLEAFLEKYRQERELIYFEKQKYEDFLNNKESFLLSLMKELDNGLLSLDYLKILFIPSLNIETVKRFNKFGNNWGYVKDKLDCISFKTSNNILFHGIGLLKPLKSGEKLNVDMKLLDGESNEANILIEKSYIIQQKDADIIEKIIMDNAILLKKEKVYSICCKIEGEDSFNGSEGMEIIENEGIFFNFSDTIVIGNNKDNNTNVNHGQIPEIYYSIMEEK